MCSGSNSKICPSNLIMEGESCRQKSNILCNCSALLELAASDDLVGFKSEVEEKGLDVDGISYWYGRSLGSKRMGFEERTPLMIAATLGSTNVLKYAIASGKVDINRACGSDEVTALHCAVAGGSNSSAESVKLLIDASADVNLVDANGNKPSDLLTLPLKSPYNSRRKLIELLLRGENLSKDEEEKLVTTPQLVKEGTEKKEYPMDVTLPDINNEIYSTDEFRMYSFKIKPCSRAYSHDWTECPFVHPGENARRRDPRKYPYSCVPCPEFRKGTCQKGAACDYAHGVFESRLHPAQYRTRLCKDETGCMRKVCFFAHKPEELRPVYASTGSALPSPQSASLNVMGMVAPSSLAVVSSLPLPTVSTPLMSPQSTGSSSPQSGGLWQNNNNLSLPALQLPGSRLKTALCARDLDLEMELLGLENQTSHLQQQQLMDEISGLLSPSCWSKNFNRIGDLNPTKLDDVFGSPDASLLSPEHGMSLNSATATQIQSPNGLQIRQNMNQLRANYPSNLPYSPVRKPASYGFDSSAAVAAAVMNSRSSAFANRSQSFIDHAAVTNHLGLTAAANSVSLISSNLSGWNSPYGKLGWGIQGDKSNKLKRSTSFGFRSNSNPARTTDFMPSNFDEPDVSWVNSLVKDVASVGSFGTEKQHNLGKGDAESIPSWMEQLYREQEQKVA